jgi:hypothetical protein
MIHGAKRLAIVATAAAGAVGLLATAALAAGGAAGRAAGDTDDSVSPANTNVTATNSGNLTVSFTVLGQTITVTCTSTTLSLTTPASGLTVSMQPPTISGCTDNFGGTETVTTSGTWQLAFKDARNDSALAEPNKGDHLLLTVPTGGATVQSSLLPCTISSTQSTVKASYNDKNKAKFTNQQVSGSGCGGSNTATFNGTFLTNINVSDSTS